jgi:chromatin assembly factor 1 subunit B
MQVYDLAWSPTGEYIISGSTDNVARIFLVSEGDHIRPCHLGSMVFTTSSGKCVSEIAEHNHYVQGVAWDPLNEFIATQSSDRFMHVYTVSTKSGAFEVHAVGKNSRIAHHHTRTPSSTPSSHSRPRMFRRESTASDTESVTTTVSEQIKEDGLPYSASGGSQHQNVPLTPATSIASTPQSMFPPPPMEKPSSRRSSFSGSNAPSSPALYSRYARSPSPLPALPAIRTAIPSPSTWNSVRLYGDEGFTNFFRRLTFSPDGGLLLTPAGQFEDPSVIPGTSRSSSGNKTEEARGRKGYPEAVNPNSVSSVYIYSRANFARPPVAQLPGHKKASVAVRFSPILYELRPGVFGLDAPIDTKHVVVERGKDTTVNVDVGAPPASMPSTPALSATSETSQMLSPLKTTLLAPLALPAAVPSLSTPLTLPSPVLSATDSLRASSPAVSKPPTPAPPPSSGSVFALPYRMLFAVATMDTVAIHDTQQAGPICLLTKLHYDEFTDMSWLVFHSHCLLGLSSSTCCRSPDGQCLMLSSRDGYCTIVVFDEILSAHHVQQQTLQFQSIAHNHSVPLTSSSALTPSTTPALSTVSLPPSLSPRMSSKRPLTPIKSVVPESDVLPESTSVAEVPPATSVDNEEQDKAPRPPKKKRRVALTRIGDVGS